MLYLLGAAFLLGALGGWVAGLLRPHPRAPHPLDVPPARQERA